MCLSDTAEYWWDIKNKQYKHTFTHIKGIDCGHYHVYETEVLDNIDCYACKKLISDDLELKERLRIINDEFLLKEEKKKLNKLKQAKENSVRKNRKNPICSCGYVFVKRTNHKNRNEFWGCFNYPSCKNTKSI